MSDQQAAASGPPVDWVVEAGKIGEFARAVLNQSAAYEPTDAVAPPTFPQSMALWRARRGSARRGGGGGGGRDMRRVLHGEQEFEYVRPLRAGDVLTATSHVKNEYEKEGKRGGTMRFVVSETVFRDQAGEIVAYSRGTTIVTSKAATE
ncbi:MAG: MaoC family dehydratase N-terminal domain-containing protein [Actinomycetota bacterium]